MTARARRVFTDEFKAEAVRLVQTSGKTVAQSSVRAINNQTAVGCNICFTCGGDWPVFAGSIRSVGDFPTERGSGCSGPLQGRADGSPFLCCR